MSNYATTEAMADWLAFRADFEPVQGVDFDHDEPTPTTPLVTTTPDAWGAMLATEDFSAVTVPF